MMRTAILGAVAIGLCCAGCTTEATAQATKKPTVEFGVFEFAMIFEVHGAKERYRWTTGEGRIEGADVGPLWTALGMEGAPNPDGADRMQVLNRLHALGWELVDTNDVSFVMAGGTAFANRYILRRRA